MKTKINIEGKTVLDFPDFIRNDSGNTVLFEILQENDLIIDITGYIIKFKMKKIDANTLKIDSNCNLDDPINGICSYTFQVGDLDTEGVYDAELELTNGTIINTIQLKRFRILRDL